MAKVYNPRLRGKNPTQYLGDPSPNPPNMLEFDRAPTVNDYSGFDINDIWLHQKTPQEWYVLVNKEAKVATWLHVVTGDVTFGVVGTGTLRADSGVISTIVDGTDLEVYMGDTGNEAEWGLLTSTGTTVTITRTPLGINFEAAGGASGDTFTTDDANTVVPTAGGNIDMAGGNNITTTGAVANQILTSLNDSIVLAGNITAVDATFSGDVDINGDIEVDNITVTTFGEGVVVSDAVGVLSSVASPVIPLAINFQTGTTYTLVLTDASKEVSLDNAAAIALTIPPNASVAFDVGTQIIITQTGAGTVTVGPGGGVTINSAGARLDLFEQYSGACLVKQSLNVWLLMGDIN